MNAEIEKPPEDWGEFQKRVFAAESHYGLGFMPHIRAAAVVAIVIGLLLVMIHFFVGYKMIIYNFGCVLVGAGVVIFIIIHWVNSGSSVMVKERRKSIQERGMRSRCQYLDGDLPDGLSDRSGYCNLYKKSIVSYPYCIYCKSYKKKQLER